MSKNPINVVTVSYFDPALAAAARGKALELAEGNANRLVMLKSNVYVVMNSATHPKASPKVLKRLRKDHGLA
jgi:hypothetical protein